jgi:succinate-acetate transporter protein
MTNSTRTDIRDETASANGRNDERRSAGAERGYDDEHVRWQDRGRVVLTPIAAPSIMGLTGFMLATVMVGAWQAGWYGHANSAVVLWPLALVAGGLLQSAAALWSFRARDGVAVAVHTAWGSFWIGWGILQLLVTTGVTAPIGFGTVNPSFGFWFVGLTLVTGTCMFAALADNIAISLVLAALTGGAALTAAGFFAGSLLTDQIGGWFFVVSAGLAWYAVSGMVLEHAFGRTILPVGATKKARNIPGRRVMHPIEYAEGMPGVRVGQ